MPKIITIANLKGGCGKSNIAVNLAGELARKAGSVMVIDADGQGTATNWADAGLLPFPVHSLPLEHPREGAKWIDRILSLDAAVLIVDCPPHVGAATAAAVGVSDLVLVPVFSSAADLRATVQALDLIRAARADRKDRGPLCLLVPSRIDRRTSSGREIETALEQFGNRSGPQSTSTQALSIALLLASGSGIPHRRAPPMMTSQLWAWP